MLYLIGIGLSEGDMTEKALRAIRACDSVYSEEYTNRFVGSISHVEKITGKSIQKISREQVESDFLINEAAERNVCLLVPGDPLAATTHFQLILDAREKGIKTEVVHSVSVYAAIAATGLHIYKFGRSTTLAEWATSPYDITFENKTRGLHTLILLDTKDGKHMNTEEALGMLGRMEAEKGKKIFLPDTMLVLCSCLGSNKEKVIYTRIRDAPVLEPPITMALPGELNFKEEEALGLWKKG